MNYQVADISLVDCRIEHVGVGVFWPVGRAMDLKARNQYLKLHISQKQSRTFIFSERNFQAVAMQRDDTELF